eukprot:TRINITY_DN2372_c0_g1_i1.p1 TRINITY_DN2372_c0_g1~~TRINITY_DN2372_c0_g1_i1.p1  ORF type:complete len:530 (+),score=137.75 TRINITY_DN2372_c0_g1_i1:109-1698(+)
MSSMDESTAQIAPMIFAPVQFPAGCQQFVFLHNGENVLCWPQASVQVACTDFSNINNMSEVACAQNDSCHSLPNIEGKMWHTQFLIAGTDFSSNDTGDFAVSAQNEASKVLPDISKQMWYMQSSAATEQEQQSSYDSAESAMAQEDTAYHAPDDALDAWQGSQSKTRRRGGRRHNKGSQSAGLGPKVSFIFEALEDHMATNPEYKLPVEPASAIKPEQVPAALPAKVGLQVLCAGKSTSHEDPMSLVEDKDFAEKIKKDLDDAELRTLLIKWMLQALPRLACSAATRVVQKAIEVADSKLQKDIIAALEPHAVELYESPEGNYVLQKLIETCTPDSLQGVRNVLEGKGWEEVAQHRYGCRALERFLEQTSKMEQLESLIAVIEARAVAMSCNKFASHVVKHVFEYVPAMRGRVLASILPETCTLAKTKYGSWVVQKALDHCNQESKSLIARAFLDSEQEKLTLEDVACDQYGSHVAKQLANLSDKTLRSEIYGRFSQSQDRLGKDHFGRKVLEGFEIPVPFLLTPGYKA